MTEPTLEIIYFQDNLKYSVFTNVFLLGISLPNPVCPCIKGHGSFNFILLVFIFNVAALPAVNEVVLSTYSPVLGRYPSVENERSLPNCDAIDVILYWRTAFQRYHVFSFAVGNLLLILFTPEDQKEKSGRGWYDFELSTMY